MSQAAIIQVVGIVLKEAVTHGMAIAKLVTSKSKIEDNELYKRLPKTRRILIARAQRKVRQQSR